MFVVMSTCCQPNEKGSVLRRQRDGTRISLPCPQAIIQYNTYMGGVDRGDQLRGYYSCRSKSRKFYKYIFYFLLDTTITNAYILYTRHTESPTFKHMKDFRVALAKSLIGDYCSRRRPGRGGTALRSIPLRHFPTKVDGDVRNKRGRCILWERETTHAGGARNVGCGCATLDFQTLTVSYSGIKTSTKSDRGLHTHTLLYQLHIFLCTYMYTQSWGNLKAENVPLERSSGHFVFRKCADSSKYNR